MKNEALRTQDADVRKLGELIKGQRIAMLTSIDEDGTLHARPMATLEADFNGTLWFFTNKHSAKVHEVEQDEHVNVAYCDHSDNRYVSVRGLARLSNDADKKAELWNPIHKAWFPDGLEDPELRLLRVVVQRAEFWDSPSSTMVHLAGFAKAIISGEGYKPSPGEVGEINFTH